MLIGLPMEPAIGPNGAPVTVQIETRGGIHQGKSLADEGWPHAICFFSIPMSKEMLRKIAS